MTRHVVFVTTKNACELNVFSKLAYTNSHILAKIYLLFALRCHFTTFPYVFILMRQFCAANYGFKSDRISTHCKFMFGRKGYEPGHVIQGRQ